MIAQGKLREKWNSDVGLTKIEKDDIFPCDVPVPDGVRCEVIFKESNYTMSQGWFENNDQDREYVYLRSNYGDFPIQYLSEKSSMKVSIDGQYQNFHYGRSDTGDYYTQ